MQTSIRSPKTTSVSNNRRLYWAIIRIFIGLTSAAFFLYFLVSQCISFVQVTNIEYSVTVSVAIIDWVKAMVDEEETTVYLLQNNTAPQPNPYDSGSSTPVTLPALMDMQSRSMALLRDLTENMRVYGMLRNDNEYNQLLSYASQLMLLQNSTNTLLLYPPPPPTPVPKNGTSSLSPPPSLSWSSSFPWAYYFQLTDAWRVVRLFMLDVVARNTNFENQQVAQYSVCLTAVMYYRETISQVRDAVLHYVLFPSINNRDLVVERNKAMDIYLREITQKLPVDLLPYYTDGMALPEWQHCNDTLKDTIYDVRHVNNSLDVFNATQWYYCCNVLVHEMRVVRDRMKALLMDTLERYVTQLETALVLAVVGIVLELLAAGTLIYQAFPVLMLYIKMQSLVKVSGQISTTPSPESAGSRRRVRSGRSLDGSQEMKSRDDEVMK